MEKTPIFRCFLGVPSISKWKFCWLFMDPSLYFLLSNVEASCSSPPNLAKNALWAELLYQRHALFLVEILDNEFFPCLQKINLRQKINPLDCGEIYGPSFLFWNLLKNPSIHSEFNVGWLCEDCWIKQCRNNGFELLTSFAGESWIKH